MSENHGNIIACSTQLRKINELLIEPVKDDVSSVAAVELSRKQALGKRILFFTNPSMKSAWIHATNVFFIQIQSLKIIHNR